MITKPTVLILGAGASSPYGLPTAGEIADAVVAEYRGHGGPITARLAECGYTAQTRTFFEAFTESGYYSLDAFVLRRPEFRDIAKVTLAIKLMESEDDARLLAPPEHDWYRFLFSRMMPKDPESFRSNRLAIVTFNFDRSFERRLARTLVGTYGVERAADLLSAVPVLHLHGQFGALKLTDEAFGRPYAVEQRADEIQRYARDIKLVDDEIDTAVLTDARNRMDHAETICFVGFSFQPENLDRLQAKTLNQKTLFGTCRGMSDADVSRVYRYFNCPRSDYLLPYPARQFFNAVDLF
jgi:hypothetical protein